MPSLPTISGAQPYTPSISRLLKNAHLSRWSGIALIMLHCGVRKVRLIVCLKAEDNMALRALVFPFRVIQAIRCAYGCWLLMISHALHLSIYEQPAFIDFFNNLLVKSYFPDRKLFPDEAQGQPGDIGHQGHDDGAKYQEGDDCAVDYRSAAAQTGRLRRRGSGPWAA